MNTRLAFPIALLALALPFGAIAQQQVEPQDPAQAPPAVPAIPARPMPANPANMTGQADARDASGNIATVISHSPMPAQRDHRTEFDALDTNRDGGISRREAKADGEMLRAFGVYDADHNGRLDYDEALRWLDD